MNDPELTLVVGEYNSSSWSLSAWLLLRLTGLPFEEIRIPLNQYETAGMVRDYSPSGLLPVLIAGKLRIWDTLAIGEYLYEFDRRLWPEDPRQRAMGRAICAEIHSGFHDLLTFLPMDLISRFSSPGMVLSGVERDVERLCAIWDEYRVRDHPAGPFMFGNFTIIDAVMAPLASRLVTHGIDLPPNAEDYVDSVMSWPDMTLWQGHAAEECEEAETMPLDVISRECPPIVPPVVESVVLRLPGEERLPTPASTVEQAEPDPEPQFEREIEADLETSSDINPENTANQPDEEEHQPEPSDDLGLVEERLAQDHEAGEEPPAPTVNEDEEKKDPMKALFDEIDNAPPPSRTPMQPEQPLAPSAEADLTKVSPVDPPWSNEEPTKAEVDAGEKSGDRGATDESIAEANLDIARGFRNIFRNRHQEPVEEHKEPAEDKPSSVVKPIGGGIRRRH